jgi:hypothetical protein
MNAKAFIVGSIVGCISLFIGGYVLFDLLLGGFFSANAQSLPGLNREPPLFWALALGLLANAGLICYAMHGRSFRSVSAGAKIGATVGFLLWFAADVMQYGFMNLANLTGTLVGPVVDAVNGAIAGALIALVVSKLQPAEGNRQ